MQIEFMFDTNRAPCDADCRECHNIVKRQQYEQRNINTVEISYMGNGVQRIAVDTVAGMPSAIVLNALRKFLKYETASRAGR